MSTGAYTDVLFIVTFILGLLWGVVLTVLFLTLRRQANLPFYYTPIFGAKPQGKNATRTGEYRAVNYLAGSTVLEGKEAYGWASRPFHNDIPPEWRLPIREGTPDQIIIHIEPDGTPTQERVNIQRIIQHLQGIAPQKH